MDKKEFILKILDAVQDTRDMAPGLRLLVQEKLLDEKTIDTLVKAFRQAAKQTENQQAQQALEKGADLIEDIHKKEEIEHQKDLEDLAELEEMFKNIE